MRASVFFSFAFLSLAILGVFVIFPEIDLWASGLFATATDGFFFQGAWPLVALNKLAFYGARVLGGLFLGGTVWACFRKGPVAGLSAKAWFFLFLALVIGPGLVANVIFKDHWGRARPREVTAFAGKARFTPPLIMTDQCRSNCSFVSGDGAFGFFLPTIAYVLPTKRRRAFKGLLGVGLVFAIARIVVGAHFLSDVLFAAFFMFSTSALLHTAMFGWARTKECWASWVQCEKR